MCVKKSKFTACECCWYVTLLPAGSEEREVLGVGSIPVAILPSCQDMKTIAI